MSYYGNCECGRSLRPMWFTEEETKVESGRMYYTGRERKAVSSLSCDHCLKNYPVDDSFDGEWYYKK